MVAQQKIEEKQTVLALSLEVSIHIYSFHAQGT
jgi:hypothetical protein